MGAALWMIVDILQFSVKKLEQDNKWGVVFYGFVTTVCGISLFEPCFFDRGYTIYANSIICLTEGKTLYC